MLYNDDPPIGFAALFRQYLLDLDMSGIRKLWQMMAPHLPQPLTDEETLMTMHSARAQMKSLPIEARAYSEQWLKERRVGQIISSVGISVIAPPRRAEQAANIRAAMSEAVMDSIKAGLDLDVDAGEVRRRMLRARDHA